MKELPDDFREQVEDLLEEIQTHETEQHTKAPYRITISSHGQFFFVSFVGRMMFASPEAVTRKLQQLMQALSPDSNVIAVDLSECDFLASSAIGVVVEFFRDTLAQNAKVTLVAPPEVVLRSLKLIGLGPLFTIVETREQAVRMFLEAESQR